MGAARDKARVEEDRMATHRQQNEKRDCEMFWPKKMFAIIDTINTVNGKKRGFDE